MVRFQVRGQPSGSGSRGRMRIFAISDIHVDYPDNRAWLEGLSNQDYQNDTLILAGDVTHDMNRLEWTFVTLMRKFARLFFVPGNHELWLLKTHHADSVEKFYGVLECCRRLRVSTKPEKLDGGSSPVWLVPLFSWYLKPEEGDASLFLPKPGEDPSLRVWSDNYFIKWPSLPDHDSPNAYFLAKNEPHLQRAYDAPVISFSHFLPRSDLMFSTPEERRNAKYVTDSNVEFNFSRVAGSKDLETQIRRLRPRVHVYGHQHRNRDRTIDGVRYISHCLGYGHERKRGQIRNLTDTPLKVWDGSPVSMECG